MDWIGICLLLWISQMIYQIKIHSHRDEKKNKNLNGEIEHEICFKTRCDIRYSINVSWIKYPPVILFSQCFEVLIFFSALSGYIFRSMVTDAHAHILPFNIFCHVFHSPPEKIECPIDNNGMCSMSLFYGRVCVCGCVCVCVCVGGGGGGGGGIFHCEVAFLYCCLIPLTYTHQNV